MLKKEYNLPVFEDTDKADLNEYTEQLVEALKVQIDKFGNPLTFRGTIETVEDLPKDATAGDIYNVTDINKNYVYSGSEWLEYSDTTDNSCQKMISDKYNTSKTYAIGDYCIYENTLYKCIVEITTAEVFDSSKWKKTSVDKEIDNIETAIEEPRGIMISETTTNNVGKYIKVFSVNMQKINWKTTNILFRISCIETGYYDNIYNLKIRKQSSNTGVTQITLKRVTEIEKNDWISNDLVVVLENKNLATLYMKASHSGSTPVLKILSFQDKGNLTDLTLFQNEYIDALPSRNYYNM